MEFLFPPRREGGLRGWEFSAGGYAGGFAGGLRGLMMGGEREEGEGEGEGGWDGRVVVVRRMGRKRKERE